MSYMLPVSYTHLDVYKRQILRIRCEELSSNFEVVNTGICIVTFTVTGLNILMINSQIIESLTINKIKYFIYYTI